MSRARHSGGFNFSVGQKIRGKIRPYLRKARGGGISAVLARGASGAFVVNVAGAGLVLAVQVLLARLLGAESYGDYVYALTWMNILILPGKLGLDTAALRFVSAYNGKGEWGLLRGFLRRSAQMVFASSVFVALAVSGVVWLFRDRLSPELAAAFWGACLLLVVNVLLQVQSNSLVALKRVVLAQSPQAILRPLFLAGGMILVAATSWRPLDAPTAMLVNVAAAVGALAIMRRFLRRALPRAVHEARASYETRTWAGVGWSLVLVSGLLLVLNQTGVIMLGFYEDTTEAGIYATASRIAAVIVFGLTAVNTIAAPMFSEYYSQGRMGELQRVVTLAARGIMAFSLPVSLVFIFGGGPLLGLFGPEFTRGYWALAILTVGQLVNASVGSVGFLMSMTGHQREAARVFAGAAVLNVVLNASLIPLWGINGAAIATATTTIIWNVALALYVWRRLGVRATIV